jgi:hypothetical protein
MVHVFEDFQAEEWFVTFQMNESDDKIQDR